MNEAAARGTYRIIIAIKIVYSLAYYMLYISQLNKSPTAVNSEAIIVIHSTLGLKPL